MMPDLGPRDSSLALLREGYTFVSRRCDQLGTDAFRTRLLLSPAVCMRGADAARIFYSGDRFTRQGAFPKSVLHLLQDEGSVQSLDGDLHRARKAMFLQLLQGAAAEQLTEIFEREWYAALPRWQHAGRVVLFGAVNELLTRTAAAWAGAALAENEVTRRAHELAEMRNRAASIGPANWWARALRNRSERWARQVVEQSRSGQREPAAGSALALLAQYREPDGEPLDVAIAAVELLNILRPIAAVSRFVVFTALALLRHPQWARTFAGGDDTELSAFVHEVRRTAPFFPLVAGRVRQPFSWHEYHFPVGERVCLDLYGTNHDPRLWEDPEAFLPERFSHWQGDPFTLIPQGGGEYADDHRCPGEPVTNQLLARAVQLLTRATRYHVPAQDLSVSTRRLPALPHDGFVIDDIRSVGPR